MLLDGEEKACIKRRNGRVWVRGWKAKRQEMGAFHRIVRELATEDPSSFMEYLRMEEDHFNHLVSLVLPLIKKEDMGMGEAISPAERVALALCFWPLESRSIRSPFSFAYRDMLFPTLSMRPALQ